jgi:trk system potassium uptake protein TrkA
VRPRIDIAEEIYRNMGLPGFVKLEGLFGNTVMLIDVCVMRDSCLKGRTLAYVRANIRKDMLISTVIRDDKLFIPDGNFTLEEGDILTVCASQGALESTLETLGISRNRDDSVMLVGCGIIGEYLTEMLLKDGKRLTILENDIARCRHLMERFPGVNVVYSEGEITEVLEEEGLSRTGTLISLTDSDETNLVISMFAWSKKVPSVITRVDKQSHVRLLHKVNIDITASPTELSLQRLLHYIRNRENRKTLRDVLGKSLKLSKPAAKENAGALSTYHGFYRVAEGRAEVMEFGAGRDFKALDIPLREKSFHLKKGILISGIIRAGELIIPTGDTSVKECDRVLVTAPVEKGIRMLNDILG